MLQIIIPQRKGAEKKTPTFFGSILFLIIFVTPFICILDMNSRLMAQDLGGLLITPTGIVFEGRQRSAEITIVNTKSTPATYRISFKNMRMLEDGSYADIEKPENGELFADKLIRYSPRQVRLEPGVVQTVRLLLRTPANLTSGEYRSHLLFQPIPSEAEGESIEDTELQEDEIGVRIKVVYAISIPVIVRHGDLFVSATMSELSLEPSGDTNNYMVLSFVVNRVGNKSVSGEVEVMFESDQGGSQHLAGYVRGVVVLYPYPTRKVNIRLALNMEGNQLPKGILHIIYRARPQDGGAIQAEAELRIP